MPELMLSEISGIKGEKVIFTSNESPAEEYLLAYKQGNIINLDDITHIQYLKNALGGKLPETIWFRYNPGNQKQGCNSIIGKPEEAKYGLTREQMIEAYKICKAEGVKHFGLHTMVASNELNPDFFSDSAKLVFELAVEIKEKTGVKIEFTDLGGGIGIPYKPDQKNIDYKEIAKKIRILYDKMIVPAGLDPLGFIGNVGVLLQGLMVGL